MADAGKADGAPPGDDRSFAYIIEGGSAREVATASAHDAPRAERSLLWIHLHGPDDVCDAWLSLQGDVPDPARAALTAVETRPRCQSMGDSALVNLRGIGDAQIDSADPLVSIRMWLQHGRVISVVRAGMNAVGTLREAVVAGRVSDPGELVAVIAGAISKPLDAVIADVGDALDEIEATLATDEGADLRRATNAIRGRAIAYRRFIVPERVALETLSELPGAWLDEHDRTDLREAANRFARMTEELDAIRERAALVSDQLIEVRAEVMERRSFVLSIVALIFLPLTFFTGLLGINVEGIWYAEHPFAFNAVVIICVVTAAVLAAYFFVRHWFRG